MSGSTRSLAFEVDRRPETGRPEFKSLHLLHLFASVDSAAMSTSHQAGKVPCSRLTPRTGESDNSYVASHYWIRDKLLLYVYSTRGTDNFTFIEQWVGKLFSWKATISTCVPLKAAVKVSLPTKVLYTVVWLWITVIWANMCVQYTQILTCLNQGCAKSAGQIMTGAEFCQLCSGRSCLIKSSRQFQG